jgi:putative DNA primase/helicase
MFKLDRIIPCPEGYYEYLKSCYDTRTFEPGEPPSDFVLDGSRSMAEAARYIDREIERGNLPQQGIRNAHSFEHYASLYEYGVSAEVARALYERFYDAGGLRPDEGDTKIERRIADIWSGKADVGKPGSKLLPLASEIHDPIMVERMAHRGETRTELLQLSRVKRRPIGWLWRHWLAQGKIHLLAGEPGCGKSTLALKILATITRGDAWPDGSPAPQGRVLIWSGEDNVEDTILPRFEAAGGDTEMAFAVGASFDPDFDGNDVKRMFDPSRDMQRLLAVARKMPDLKAIMIDPIVTIASKVDSHNNAEVRGAMMPLYEFAEEANVAVIGITHFTKGSMGKDPAARVTGSLAFAAMARLVWAAAKSEDGSQRVLVRAKSNIGPDTDGYAFALTRDGNEDQTAGWGDKILGTPRDILDKIAPKKDAGRPPAERTACANLILERLKDGPVPCGRLQESLIENGGIARATFFRALQELREWVENVPNERPNMDRRGDRECYRLKKPTQ